jgi:hypothetical protein
VHAAPRLQVRTVPHRQGLPVQIKYDGMHVTLTDDSNSTQVATITQTIRTCAGYLHLIDNVLNPCCDVTTDSCSSAPFEFRQEAVASDAINARLRGDPLPGLYTPPAPSGAERAVLGAGAAAVAAVGALLFAP